MSEYTSQEPDGGEPAGGAGIPVAERMQQLLSRAVDDQVQEQRQVQDLLGEVRELLTRIPDEIHNAARTGYDARSGAAHDALDSRAEQIERGVAQRVDVSLAEIRDRLAATERTLTERVGATEHVVGQRVGATEHVIAARVGASEHAVAERVDSLTARLSELYGRLDTLEERLDSIAVSVGDSERRVTEHMDEAILALAEALLRRWVSLAGGPTALPSGRSSAENTLTAYPAEPVAAEPAAPTGGPPPGVPESPPEWTTGLLDRPVGETAPGGEGGQHRGAEDPLGGQPQSRARLGLDELDTTTELDLTTLEPVSQSTRLSELLAEEPAGNGETGGNWAHLIRDEEDGGPLDVLTEEEEPDAGRRRRPWWRPGD